MSGSMSLQTGAGGDIRSGATDGRPLTPGVDTSHRAILYLDSVSVSFEGFRALNKLSLTVDDGELRCVIGPNGAGKTTMMDVITGKTRPDEGTAFFGQTIDLTRLNEPEIAHAGIGRKFQKPTVFEQHTVFENLELAMKADKRVGPTLFARLDSSERDRILRTLELIHLVPDAKRPAGVLSHGQKQWLEIGMLLMQEPELPAARRARRRHERRRDDAQCGALPLACRPVHAGSWSSTTWRSSRRSPTRVTVLHEGRVLAEGSMHKIQQDERVIEVFLGR